MARAIGRSHGPQTVKDGRLGAEAAPDAARAHRAASSGSVEADGGLGGGGDGDVDHLRPLSEGSCSLRSNSAICSLDTTGETIRRRPDSVPSLMRDRVSTPRGDGDLGEAQP